MGSLFLSHCSFGRLRPLQPIRQSAAGLERSHADLLAKTEELERANRGLHEAQAHLVEKERLTAVGQVVVGLHHAILIPLAGVLGTLQVLKDAGCWRRRRKRSQRAALMSATSRCWISTRTRTTSSEGADWGKFPTPGAAVPRGLRRPEGPRESASLTRNTLNLQTIFSFPYRGCGRAPRLRPPPEEGTVRSPKGISAWIASGPGVRW